MSNPTLDPNVKPAGIFIESDDVPAELPLYTGAERI
jgi:hypothetical protein